MQKRCPFKFSRKTPLPCPNDFFNLHASRPKLSEIQTPASIDYRAIYYILRERAWIIALCLLVAALVTATILLRSPSIYASTTVLLVEQEEAKVVDIQRIQPEDFQSLESLKTVEQLSLIHIFRTSAGFSNS